MKVLFSILDDIRKIKNIKPDTIFSDEVVAFLNALSGILMRNPVTRMFPDVATFAFFCRKGNILAQAAKYKSNSIRMGRGVLFHVTPSNVPVNFAYSLVAGLLSGNSNIVRVPSKKFEQVELIVKAIYELSLIDEYQSVTERISLIRYERGGEETEQISAIADVRIIWGGDETISQIRKSPIPPRSFDITFADRYSFAIIDAQSVLSESNLPQLAEHFYNDTLLFDQNACSSPHLIIWHGSEPDISTAKMRFWEAFHTFIASRYHVEPIIVVNKLTAFYRQAIESDIKMATESDNIVWRVELNSLPVTIDEYRCAGGYFSEYSTNNLMEVAPIISARYQTLAYYGIHKDILKDLLVDNRINGVDRIVPIGKTTEFALTWDGYNLIETLSRELSIL